MKREMWRWISKRRWIHEKMPERWVCMPAVVVVWYTLENIKMGRWMGDERAMTQKQSKERAGEVGRRTTRLLTTGRKGGSSEEYLGAWKEQEGRQICSDVKASSDRPEKRWMGERRTKEEPPKRDNSPGKLNDNSTRLDSTQLALPPTSPHDNDAHRKDTPRTTKTCAQSNNNNNNNAALRLRRKPH
ncbi:hypothetical protein IWX50DRAFT_648747 [Phyllosticta citricarpa]|uniref:Uncharacterized protein n=1 Tax=Phyllosticta citricarpa TaxID=55181 RepID=A0ABR1L7M5_9PEZI